MVVDKAGYRLNVGIIVVNHSGHVFWGRRLGRDSWQFPQGGVMTGESAIDAMYRELHEEIGLDKDDVELLGSTKRWLKYRLPKQFVRQGTTPLVIGQRQKWFLLSLKCPDQKIRLDLNDSPEFDSWRWVEMSLPPEQVIYFKRQVYRQAIKELSPLVNKGTNSDGRSKRKSRRGFRRI